MRGKKLYIKKQGPVQHWLDTLEVPSSFLSTLAIPGWALRPSLFTVVTHEIMTIIQDSTQYWMLLARSRWHLLSGCNNGSIQQEVGSLRTQNNNDYLSCKFEGKQSFLGFQVKTSDHSIVKKTVIDTLRPFIQAETVVLI